MRSALRRWVACQKYRMDVGASVSGMVVNLFQNALLIGGAVHITHARYKWGWVAAATILYPLGTWAVGWLADKALFMEAMNEQHNARNGAVQELLSRERR